MTSNLKKMEIKYGHFKTRLKERLNVDISIENVNELVKNIVNNKIQLAFNLDHRIDIYMYNYNPLKADKFCYIFFDKTKKIPLTVYHRYLFGQLIMEIK